MIGFLSISVIVDYLHLCICINAYHIGTMMDQWIAESSGVAGEMVLLEIGRHDGMLTFD